MTDAPDMPMTRGGELLAEAHFDFGFVPEQTKRLAQVVDALDGSAALISKFEISSLAPHEQQVVYLTTSRENRCRPCVAAHTHLGRLAGLTTTQLKAARAGEPLGDQRLDALQAMTLAIVRGKGRIAPEAGEQFIAAGFDREQVFEILLGVTAKMLVNFFNEIAGMPTEDRFKSDDWMPANG